jgi:hypothetical protein
MKKGGRWSKEEEEALQKALQHYRPSQLDEIKTSSGLQRTNQAIKNKLAMDSKSANQAPNVKRLKASSTDSPSKYAVEAAKLSKGTTALGLQRKAAILGKEEEEDEEEEPPTSAVTHAAIQPFQFGKKLVTQATSDHTLRPQIGPYEANKFFCIWPNLKAQGISFGVAKWHADAQEDPSKTITSQVVCKVTVAAPNKERLKNELPGVDLSEVKMQDIVSEFSVHFGEFSISTDKRDITVVNTEHFVGFIAALAGQGKPTTMQHLDF